MKAFFPLLLACGLSLSTFAQEAKTNAAPESAAAVTNLPPPVVVLPASTATVTAPLVLTNGVLSQPDMTAVEDGGKAVFAFAITNEGDYVITGQVNAPDDSSNSFFLNVDAQPEEPTMIWDIDVTTGFETRTANWRGEGDAGSDEFSPKKFHLTAGSHKLILVGREPAELKSLAICPAPK
jgi:hypothetical protein